MLVFELSEEIVDHPVVQVLSSEVSVSGGGLDLEKAVHNVEDVDINGFAAEVEYEDVAIALALPLV